MLSSKFFVNEDFLKQKEIYSSTKLKNNYLTQQIISMKTINAAKKVLNFQMEKIKNAYFEVIRKFKTLSNKKQKIQKSIHKRIIKCLQVLEITLKVLKI